MLLNFFKMDGLYFWSVYPPVSPFCSAAGLAFVIPRPLLCRQLGSRLSCLPSERIKLAWPHPSHEVQPAIQCPKPKLHIEGLLLGV